MRLHSIYKPNWCFHHHYNCFTSWIMVNFAIKNDSMKTYIFASYKINWKLKCIYVLMNMNNLRHRMNICGSIIMFSAHIKSKRYVHNHKSAVGSFLCGSTQDVSQLLTCWERLFFSLRVDIKKVYFFRVTQRKTKPPLHKAYEHLNLEHVTYFNTIHQRRSFFCYFLY